MLEKIFNFIIKLTCILNCYFIKKIYIQIIVSGVSAVITKLPNDNIRDIPSYWFP